MTPKQLNLFQSAYCSADRASQLAEKLFRRVAENPGVEQVEFPIEDLTEFRRLLVMAKENNDKLIADLLVSQKPERG